MQNLYKLLFLLTAISFCFIIAVCTPEKEEEKLTMDKVMRIWEEELKTIKSQLTDNNTTKIKIELSLLRAEDGIPSDSSILDDDFYRHSNEFYQSYSELFTRFADVKTYNSVVDACVNCHEQHCPSPLRSIKALYIK